MTHCDLMITMNTKFGRSKLALSDRSTWPNNGEWRIVKGPDGVLVTLILKVLDLMTMIDPVKLVGSLLRPFFHVMSSYTLLGRYDTFDHWSRGPDDNRVNVQEGPESAPIAIDRNLTGDEAFQRRLAMSARPRSPPAASIPVNEAMEEDLPAYGRQPPVELDEEANLYQSEIYRPAPSHDPPRPISPPTLAYNPFAPPSVPPPPPPGPPGTSIPSEFEAKAKAAAAIAAKLGALATVASSSEPQVPTPPVEESK